MFGKIGEFITEVKVELKKVTWPTREETLASTGIVLLVSVVVASYLGVIDYILTSIIKVILG